ncbi:MAG: YcxB family protein [Gemmatimonadaceae bacterium]|nr:YcxB family protein [Gemmatimonadaceae bacterium]NUQ92525.1 YcxB family protein [Gemmatimonadaceae bacterium]
MHLRFTVTPAMVYRAQRAIQRHVRWIRWMGYLVVGGYPLAIIALTLAYGGTIRGAIRANWIWMLAFPLLWFVVLPLLQRWTAVRTVRSTRTLQGDHAYTFAPDGVTVVTAVSTSQLAWSAFVRAVETPEFVLLFQNHITAMFIPRTAFDGPAELQAWRDLVAARIGARARWAAGGAFTSAA